MQIISARRASMVIRIGLLVAAFGFCVQVCFAATAPRGKARLRELAVVPKLEISLKIGVHFSTFMEDLTQTGQLEDWIARAKSTVQNEPNNLAAQADLARLLSASDDTNAARVWNDKLTTAARARLEQHPEDGRTMTLLAGASRSEEAESLYRRATLVASNDWRCWVGLGSFLRATAWDNLLPDDALERGGEGLLQTRPTPDAIDVVLRCRDEAAKCFHRASEIAPDEFEVLVQRAWYLSFSNWSGALIAHHKGERSLKPESLGVSLMDMMFAPAALPAYHRAAVRRPRSYKLWAMLTYMEFVTAMREATRFESIRKVSMNELPESTRRKITDPLDQLKTLASDPDPKVAAAAIIHACILSAITQTGENPIPEVERAVKLDPDNEEAWDMLIALSVEQASPEELVRICQKRLQHRKTAPNHLRVAKALYRQERFEEAGKQAKAALECDARYVPGGLMVVAVAIRMDKPEVATLALAQTGKLLEEMNDAKERRERSREVLLNSAIVLGLIDESDKARETLAPLLKQVPEDEVARSILNALP